MSVEVLHLSRASGMWRIASAGTTVYYLDLDRDLIVRARGAGSVRFVFDDRWCHLVDVLSYDLDTGEPEPDVIRVGGRPRVHVRPWTRVAAARVAVAADGHHHQGSRGRRGGARPATALPPSRHLR